MSEGKNILLINRDEEFLKQTGDILGQAGYTVHSATEMRGALSALSAQTVDLIICDKELQDISGLDFLSFIKKDPLREEIPFIFLVSIHDQGQPFKAFELGAVDFLVYPMEGPDLIKRIGEDLNLPISETSVSSSKASVIGQTHQSSQTISPPAAEKTPAQTTKPPLSVEIEVSRDGVLWFPGKIKEYDKQGIFVETSLFGKAGVSVMIRFTLPEGTAVVNGRIKHVSIDNFQSPAGTSIEIEQDMVWEKIFSGLDSMGPSAAGSTPAAGPGQEQQTDPASKSIRIVRISSKGLQGADVYKEAKGSAKEGDEHSYDTRFYYSLVGKQLDNYRTITFIGSGSMGGVFQGWDVALEREVALKVISYELACQAAFRDMFIKEARVISRLDHPNIAQIYHIGSSEDILYYAMEFIDGDTLAELIQKDGTINSLKGIEYLITVCETLDFVSKKDIIHRDIKPGNIMVNRKGIVKVVDFGVAKVKDANSQGANQEAIIGSPLYISPDSLVGRALDYRSDIYSLGASFYHAFTGYPPFEGDSIQDILDQHLNRPLIPMREKNSNVSSALAKIIEKMMAKEPKDRYQDYQSIINEFKSLRFRALNRIKKRA